MKFKRSLVALAGITLLFTGFTVLAEDGGELESDASVSFIPNDEETGPIRPVYPPTPGTPGPLSIDFVPDFNFGEQIITQTNETYFARGLQGGQWLQEEYEGQPVYDENGDPVMVLVPVEPAEYNIPLHVQITDQRGVTDGWSLSVVIDEDGFVGDLDGREVTLVGAQIRFLNMLHSADSTGVMYDVHTESSTVTLDPGVSSPRLIWSTGELDEHSRIGGSGTHILDFGGIEEELSTGVALDVVGNSMVGTLYSTTLTWTLINSPGNIPN